MKRFLHIDFLRASAILAVIAIHVFSDNLTSKLNFLAWNYLHFIIVAFIFCSGYVLYAFYAPRLVSIASVVTWYKKRLIRLLLPFYWYLLFHYILMLLFPKFFSGLGLKFSLQFILESATLIGGINLNWLPLLFLQLAVAFPIFVLLFKKYRKIFWAYCIIAFMITLGFTIWQFPYNEYRQVIWIPWSLFIILPWYFYQKEQKKLSSLPYLLLSFIGAACFVVLYFVWQHVGRSLTLIDNKYPPNFFYISYEMFGSFLITAVGLRAIFKNRYITLIYTFISRESYSLFFIHYIVMDFTLSVNNMLNNKISVWYQMVFVVGLSIVISYFLSIFQKRAKIFLQAHNPFFITS